MDACALWYRIESLKNKLTSVGRVIIWIFIMSISYIQTNGSAKGSKSLSQTIFLQLPGEGGQTGVPRFLPFTPSRDSTVPYPYLLPSTTSELVSFLQNSPPLSSKLPSHLPWRFEVSTLQKWIPSMEKTPLRRLNRVPSRFLDSTRVHLSKGIQILVLPDLSTPWVDLKSPC